jgi:hypothetical protein
MADQSDLSDWLTRIEGEYREMPGLQLTERQMRRLWGLDGTTCAVILSALVTSGFLYETPKHTYAVAASSRMVRL